MSAQHNTTHTPKWPLFPSLSIRLLCKGTKSQFPQFKRWIDGTIGLQAKNLHTQNNKNSSNMLITVGIVQTNICESQNFCLGTWWKCIYILKMNKSTKNIRPTNIIQGNLPNIHLLLIQASQGRISLESWHATGLDNMQLVGWWQPYRCVGVNWATSSNRKKQEWSHPWHRCLWVINITILISKPNRNNKFFKKCYGM